jgi:hypothetical protein
VTMALRSRLKLFVGNLKASSTDLLKPM